MITLITLWAINIGICGTAGHNPTDNQMNQSTVVEHHSVQVPTAKH